MASKTGILYVVATPIGNLDDLSTRAQRTLADVGLIAAEDTRHSRKLLQRYGITTPVIAYHEHNEQAEVPKLILRLQAGVDLALISDAGTPLVSDPGYRLVNEAHQHHLPVVSVPGPSAAIAALSVAGLPSDRFVFEGFLPARSTARRQRLDKLRSETRTMVFYEAPHRVLASLSDMVSAFGAEREVALARELTKQFETVRRDTLVGLKAWIEGEPQQQKGEIVLVVRGAQPDSEINLDDERVMDLLLNRLSVSEASQLAAAITGKKKNDFYQLALIKKKR